MRQNRRSDHRSERAFPLSQWIRLEQNASKVDRGRQDMLWCGGFPGLVGAFGDNFGAHPRDGISRGICFFNENDIQFVTVSASAVGIARHTVSGICT